MWYRLPPLRPCLQMDEEGLLTLLRLLRLGQPLGKGQLQRLMHNLCANSETREVRSTLNESLLVPLGYFVSLSGNGSCPAHKDQPLGTIPCPPIFLLQTLLRLLLSILRGPLTADEAAAGGGSGMEGVQRAGELRPLAEGPVLDLGEPAFVAH